MEQRQILRSLHVLLKDLSAKLVDVLKNTHLQFLHCLLYVLVLFIHEWLQVEKKCLLVHPLRFIDFSEGMVRGWSWRSSMNIVLYFQGLCIGLEYHSTLPQQFWFVGVFFHQVYFSNSLIRSATANWRFLKLNFFSTECCLGSWKLSQSLCPNNIL